MFLSTLISAKRRYLLFLSTALDYNIYIDKVNRLNHQIQLPNNAKNNAQLKRRNDNHFSSEVFVKLQYNKHRYHL